MTDVFARPDLRPYPRSERCAGCGEREVEVMGPTDWPICWLCDLTLKDYQDPPLLAVGTALRYVAGDVDPADVLDEVWDMYEEEDWE